MHRLTLIVLLFFLSLNSLATPLIRIERVPDSGIQPRLQSDIDGAVHLLYFNRTKVNGLSDKRRGSGELYYRKLGPQGRWSMARQVSPTFVHNDAIGKASFAVDDQKRVHVVWLTSNPLAYWYSRSNPGGSSFEPPRSLIAENLDGIEAEASIATYKGLVTVSWHAGDLRQESKRQVYSIISTDRGNTFGKEIAVSDPDLGACACCGLATEYQNDGEFVLAYRSAIDNTGRHMQLLVAPDNLSKSQTTAIGTWQINTCPVSSNAIKGPWLVFETAGKIKKFDIGFDIGNSSSSKLVIDYTDGERQKHPAIAINSTNNHLISWGEAPGYFTGGQLKLALFDSENRIQKTLDTSGFLIPYFSVSAVAALNNGDFIVLY